LTEYEETEKDRVSNHESALNDMAQQIALGDNTSPNEIERRIARSIEIGKGRDWQEFAIRARNIYEETYDILRNISSAIISFDSPSSTLWKEQLFITQAD
jgi:hypothetical protein